MLKTVSSITNAIGALNFKGTWDANANSPALASSVGTKGDYYVVGTAGSTNLNGISNWGVGDWATYNGSIWQRVEGGANLNGVDLSVSGTSTLSGLTASTALALNASKEVVSVTNTGTGDNVLATSPTLVTPVLGAATATSINKVAMTAPATAATLTIADGKTLTANASLTLAGTDATTMTFPSTSQTIAGLGVAQTFTANQTVQASDTRTGDVLGKQVMTGTATGSPFTVTITGILGTGQGDTRSMQRLNLVCVFASGTGFVARAYALYTSEYNGNAILIATLGAAGVGGGITFGVSGANQTFTCTNSGGTVSYEVNAVPLI
jgi:hypothetical protein